MTRQTIPLGRIIGIPIGLDYSWFLIFGLMTWSLATGYYPSHVRHLPEIAYWLMGAASAILLFISVLLHELGHSVVAIRHGVPVRSITMFIFGGVAEIGAEPPGPMAEFLIAIAGPIVSVLLGGIFHLLIRPMQPAMVFYELGYYVMFVNLSLAMFNLIPGFPLDGGRVLRAIVWGITRNMARATYFAANVGRFFGFCFIFLGVWQVFHGNITNGLWIAFIGWFLENAASAQVRQAVFQSAVSGHTVAQVMNSNPVFVDADLTLQQLFDDHILATGGRAFMVVRGGNPIGLMTLHRLREIPRSQWSATTAGQIMIPLAGMRTTMPKTDLWTALEQMDHDGVNQLPVMSEGRVEGMLTRENLITFMRKSL